MPQPRQVAEIDVDAGRREALDAAIRVAGLLPCVIKPVGSGRRVAA